MNAQTAARIEVLKYLKARIAGIPKGYASYLCNHLDSAFKPFARNVKALEDCMHIRNAIQDVQINIASGIGDNHTFQGWLLDELRKANLPDLYDRVYWNEGFGNLYREAWVDRMIANEED